MVVHLNHRLSQATQQEQHQVKQNLSYRMVAGGGAATQRGAATPLGGSGTSASNMVAERGVWSKVVPGAPNYNRGCVSHMAVAGGVGSKGAPRELREALITAKLMAAGSGVCFLVAPPVLKVVLNFVNPTVEEKDVCMKAAGFALKVCMEEPIFV